MSTFDNANLEVSTSDISFEGTYDYTIKVTESVSNLINDDIAFQLVLTVKIYAT